MVEPITDPEVPAGRTWPGGVRVVHDAACTTVWLDRPAVRNAQTFATWTSLRAVAASLPEPTRVVLLRGSGPDFSAGLDLRMLSAGGVVAEDGSGEGAVAELLTSDDTGVAEQIAGFQDAFTCWRELDAVVIAVVQGRAIGAGFQLALAADLRVLTEDASLVMAEVALGLVPDLGGTRRLAELVGYATALELCVSARPVPANEARRWGLANQVVPAAALEPSLERLTASILRHPEDAVRSVKRLLAGSTRRSAAEQLAAERAAQAPLLRGTAVRR